MGFWSNLGRVALGVGAGIAAPLTGGASLTALPTILGGATGALGALGGVASGVSAGRQQGRESEATFQQRQDQLGQSRYQNEMDAARLNLQAPQMRASQAMRGDILANAQPFQWTGDTRMVGNIPVPQATGGLNPGIFSEDTRSLGRLLAARALQGQQTNGGDVVGLPPELTPLPQAGKVDSILNAIGQIAPFVSLIPRMGGQGQGGSTSAPVSSNVRWPTF